MPTILEHSPSLAPGIENYPAFLSLLFFVWNKLSEKSDLRFNLVSPFLLCICLFNDYKRNMLLVKFLVNFFPTPSYAIVCHCVRKYSIKSHINETIGSKKHYANPIPILKIFVHFQWNVNVNNKLIQSYLMNWFKHLFFI